MSSRECDFDPDKPRHHGERETRGPCAQRLCPASAGCYLGVMVAEFVRICVHGGGCWFLAGWVFRGTRIRLWRVRLLLFACRIPSVQLLAGGRLRIPAGLKLLPMPPASRGARRLPAHPRSKCACRVNYRQGKCWPRRFPMSGICLFPALRLRRWILCATAPA